MKAFDSALKDKIVAALDKNKSKDPKLTTMMGGINVKPLKK